MLSEDIVISVILRETYFLGNKINALIDPEKIECDACKMLGINNVLTVNPVRGCAIRSGSMGFIVKRCYKHATPSASRVNKWS